MDVTKKISFEELMKVDNVRKHILKYVVRFSDIENLAKTCKCLCLLISGDSIGRDIMWLEIYQTLTVKCKQGLKNVSQVPILERVDIFKDESNRKILEEGSRYYGETIIMENQTSFFIKLDVGTYDHEEHVSLVQKIAEEFMLNHQLRDDVETLYFGNKCSIQERSLLIECISYMNYDSVKRIILPVDILRNCKCLHNRNVWVRDIFAGFPNLNEVIFDVPLVDRRKRGSFGNGSTITYIIKSLAKKRNGTIIFRNVHPCDDDLIIKVKKIYALCNHHGAKIKFELFSWLSDAREKSVHIKNPGNAPFSINNLVTLYELVFFNSNHFLKCVENFHIYENLEVLNIVLCFCNISDDTKSTCMLDFERYSFKSCRKLKKVQLCFFENEECCECTEEILENQFLFMGSLMPNTVEILEIIGDHKCLSMSSSITDKLNEYMPNIKMLKFYYGAIKDSDCLSTFKNLEIFIARGNPIVKIPKTVKLFVIDSSCLDSDGNENVDNQIVRKYSEKFLKYLRVSKGGCIFFNDITQWRKYKRVVQEYLY